MILRLALKDLFFDRLMSLCLVSTIAAVIAPLLLLFSLRYGILNHLYTELRDNPLNLELKMLQGYELKPEFFAALRKDSRVGFVIEMTRALSVTCDVSSAGRARTMIETIPTAEGDPILKLSGLSTAPTDSEVAVSEKLATELKLKPGDTLKVAVTRKMQGKKEVGYENFRIMGIIPASYASRECIYLSLPAVTAMEDFRDGFNPALFSDGSRLNGVRTSYAKARIYARNLEQVPSLSQELGQHYRLSDASGSIAQLQAIGRVLSFVFYTIACTSIVGGALSFGGLSLTNLGRKEQSLCQLELMGVGRSSLISLTVVEGLILGVLAYALSALLFLLGQFSFNHYFSSLLRGRTVVSLLSPCHLIAGLVLSLVIITVLTLGVSYVRLGRRDLSAALRRV